MYKKHNLNSITSWCTSVKKLLALNRTLTLKKWILSNLAKQWKLDEHFIRNKITSDVSDIFVCSYMPIRILL